MRNYNLIGLRRVFILTGMIKNEIDFDIESDSYNAYKYFV